MFRKIFTTLPSYFIYTLLWLAFFSITSAQTSSTQQATSTGAVMCTADAKRCDDGSWVGRTGPNCEFRCPAPQPGGGTSTIPRDNTSTTTASGTESYREMPNRLINQEELARQRAALEQRQVALSEERQTRITNLAANISNRMEAAVARLFVIVTRLESRIAILNQSGHDTTIPAATLRQATKTLAEARTMLTNIDVMVYQATTSDRPYSNWQTLKAHYEKVAALIRQAHTELRQVISELKPIAAGQIPKRPDQATTTSETSTTTTTVEPTL